MLAIRCRLLLLAGLLAPHIGAQTLTPGQQPLGDAIRVFGGAACVRSEALAQTVSAWLGFEVLPVTWTVVVVMGEGAPQFSIFERGKLVALRRFEELRGECPDLEAALGASIGLSLEALLVRRAEAVVREERYLEEEQVRPSEGSPLGSSVHLVFAPLTLTRPAWGGSLAFEMGSPFAPSAASDFRTRMGVIALWAEDAPLAAVSEARLTNRLLAARVGQCWGRGTESFRLQGCTDLLGGYVSGSSRGELRELGAHLPWVAWGLGLEGRWAPLPPLSLVAGVQGNVQISRPAFYVESESGREVEEFRLPPIGVMFHVGAAWSYR